MDASAVQACAAAEWRKLFQPSWTSAKRRSCTWRAISIPHSYPSMLCATCRSAFQEPESSASDFLSNNQALNPLIPTNFIPNTPFHRATHHSLPGLERSALEGCRLCLMLWTAAPLEVRHLCETTQSSDKSNPIWLPCSLTIDSAIFQGRRSEKNFLAEYKYQTVQVDPDQYKLPMKRYFGLLWGDDADPIAEAKDIGQSTESEQSWATAAAWIQDCLANHPQCRLKLSEAGRRRLPRRLLKVTDEDIVTLCDVDTTEDNHLVEYLALSHCWGGGPRLMLTSETISMLYEGVEISTLDETFQDAILITRRSWVAFAVRYLWIDSLCILQDSEADWTHESARMGDIFRHAFCTIAATAAQDGSGGLFFHRDADQIRPCLVTIVPTKGESGAMYCVDRENWAHNISNSPLNKRSWVFQERLLSPRVLHFASGQLYWECSRLEASEIFPRGLPKEFGANLKRLIPYSQAYASDEIAPVIRHPYSVWDQIMEVYSLGKLTRNSDRLVALSGVAHKMDRFVKAHDKYLAGLWKSDLAFELPWDVADPQAHPFTSEYIAPSWSWASRRGTVPCDKQTRASATSLIDVVDAKVIPATSDSMGQVHDGYLCLQGFLIRGSISLSYQPGMDYPGVSCVLSDRETSAIVCKLDDALSYGTTFPSVIYLLPVIRIIANSASRYRGLILAPTKLARKFCRIGTFALDSTDDEFLTSSSPLSKDTGDLHKNGRFEITVI